MYSIYADPREGPYLLVKPSSIISSFEVICNGNTLTNYRDETRSIKIEILFTLSIGHILYSTWDKSTVIPVQCFFNN